MTVREEACCAAFISRECITYIIACPRNKTSWPDDRCRHAATSYYSARQRPEMSSSRNRKGTYRSLVKRRASTTLIAFVEKRVCWSYLFGVGNHNVSQKEGIYLPASRRGRNGVWKWKGGTRRQMGRQQRMLECVAMKPRWRKIRGTM